MGLSQVSLSRTVRATVIRQLWIQGMLLRHDDIQIDGCASTPMDRHGHVGFDLLVFAPIAYYLMHTGQTALAVVGLLGVFVLEPLPDIDCIIPGVEHRGTSHSLFSALVAGVLVGVFLYMLSTYLVSMITQMVFGQPVAVSNVSQRSPLNATRNAWIGFFVAAGATVIHILGDSLTSSDIRPLLPFAPFRLSFDVVPEQGWAEFGLFAGGILTFSGVIISKYPGIGRALLDVFGLVLGA